MSPLDKELKEDGTVKNSDLMECWMQKGGGHEETSTTVEK